ncbi:hypothetical protein B6D60_04065 [candidate division KSB1 bacterium 4484_87]|nr:MAG: hypothetical protein B6D60_04065 [candidate division KSB1 bacterium 4484_87]
MQIQYFEPLSRAWNYMVNALFKPFDIGKWFVLGFSAFLADLLEGPGFSGANHWKTGNYKGLHGLFSIPELIKEWFLEHPGIVALIISGVFLAIAIAVLFVWLSSRGKFIFLDNVIHDRALVTQPWYKFKNEGNSLFIWRLIFGIISFLIIIFWVALLVFIIINNQNGDVAPHIGFIFLMVVSMLFIIFAILYISTFLTDFIVPIMYKNRLSATEAWRIFLDIFSQHWLYFIFYGVMKFFLYILVVAGVVLIGFFTCCFGFILLIIPYLSSVVMLPVSVTFRGFSVTFLEQFGTEFKLFPEEENVVAANE